MFDESNNMNEFDQMMKSILDEGQEEVPARVWDRVSDGLDKAAHRKVAVLWFRRAAAGIAAAAAVAIAVIFNIKSEEEGIVPPARNSGLIAVAELENEPAARTVAAENPGILISDAGPVKKAVSHTEGHVIPQSGSRITETPDTKHVTTPKHQSSQPSSDNLDLETPKTRPDQYNDFSELEGHLYSAAGHRDISFTLSGLASTNNTQSQRRVGLMKAPTVTSAPEKTGITETSTNSTYGLPVSFGAGVKIGLSEKWSVGVGANYTMLTRQFYGKYMKVDDRGNIQESTSSDIRNTQHYIGIPVNAYYEIISRDRVNLYAYAGGTVEKCVADQYDVLSTEIRHKEKVAGMQLSANAGIGVEFMLGQHLGLYVDPSVRYYFDCGQPKNIRTVQPLMLGFEMGFRARL